MEAVLAWRQQTDLLLANLTGALRLLTGLAWPMIYAHRRVRAPQAHGTAAHAHSARSASQRRSHRPCFCRSLYALVIWWKGTLTCDGCGCADRALCRLSACCLRNSRRRTHEGIRRPRTIPAQHRASAAHVRVSSPSAACFVAGGALIYFTAEPFLGSLVAVATAIGIPSFLVIQWFAPVISEFPELALHVLFRPQGREASVALMNIASSNINQWTLLVAMLPVVFSLSRGTSHRLCARSRTARSELLLTIGQSLVALMFLLNMEFAWWEALAMFMLFAASSSCPRSQCTAHASGSRTLSCAWAAFAIVAVLLLVRCQPPSKTSLPLARARPPCKRHSPWRVNEIERNSHRDRSVSDQ